MNGFPLRIAQQLVLERLDAVSQEFEYTEIVVDDGIDDGVDEEIRAELSNPAPVIDDPVDHRQEVVALYLLEGYDGIALQNKAYLFGGDFLALPP